MNRDSTPRREFLKLFAALGGLLTLARGPSRGDQQQALAAPRGRTAFGRTAKKLERIRWGLIGTGGRGTAHLRQLLTLEGCAVTALCDLRPEALRGGVEIVKAAAGGAEPAGFGDGPEAYRKLLERDDVDAVLIATPWEDHVAMSVAAMKAGKHTFVEVPAAITLEGCWDLVETAEAADVHFMMLENVCYGREELLLLHLCRQGLLGELMHAEAAYIHEFRGVYAKPSWRRTHFEQRNGNLYPTHGLGPVAQCLNINRGDQFDYLVSMSSPAIRDASSAKTEPPPRRRCGAMNTSLLKTALGRTIMVQFDVTTPRPYTRHLFVQGTGGAFGGFPNRIAIKGRTDTQAWETDMAKWFAEFDHPLWRKAGAQATLAATAAWIT